MKRNRTPHRGRPPTGKALTPAKRMQRLRERKKAQGLKPVTRWVAVKTHAPTWSDHRLLDLRSLAMHAVIAKKVARDPGLLKVARSNLGRWQKRWGRQSPAWFGEWREILKRPWPEIAAFMTDTSEHATRLRQSSPFAGVLTSQERRRIYDAFRA